MYGTTIGDCNKYSLSSSHVCIFYTIATIMHWFGNDFDNWRSVDSIYKCINNANNVWMSEIEFIYRLLKQSTCSKSNNIL